MVGHHLIVEENHDALGIGAHQHHTAGSPRIDAVAIMIGHDQASGAGPHGFLDKPIEGAAQLHQAGAFFLEHVPDGPILELRMLCSFGVGDALIFQPGVQLGQALHARLGPEHLVAQITDLVFDPDASPIPRRVCRPQARSGDASTSAESGGCTGGALPTKIASTAVFMFRHRCRAPADPAIELKRLVVGVEHQFLGLPEVGAHKRHAAVRQLHVRHLDHQRQVLERDRLVAPVELVGFPGREAHRYIGMRPELGHVRSAGVDEAMHAVVRAIVTATAQLFDRRRVERRSRRGSFASFSRISVKTSTHSPNFGAGCTPRSYLNSVAWPRITLRTVARDTDSVRTISLIGRCC